jgi:aspartate aminotransferase-like enzyme
MSAIQTYILFILIYYGQIHMEKEPLLMLPGPVPMPERVRYAMMRQAINHRSAEFGAIYADCVRVLKTAFGTTNDLFVISGSGTAGMEAAVANFAKDKEIACLVNGKFGERLSKISQRYGKAHEIVSEWGTPLNLAALEERLDQGAEVVTLVHNETSAGIKNPAQEVGRLAQKHDALFVMDGITSIGGDVVEADAWGVDVAIVGSQKCLAAPAGLAAVSVSRKAWERLCKNPPYYLDLAAYRKSASGKPMETPYTPAVPLFLALREACLIVEEEGIANRIARHQKMARAVRAAVKEWGLSLYPKIDTKHEYSTTVTAISYPDIIKDAEMRDIIKKMGIIIAGGQDHLKGKIFRIGSMGAIGAPEILATVAATQYALTKLGYKVRGDGVQAAGEVFG